MPVSRRTYLRRRIVVFGALGTFLLAAFYLPMSLLAPLPPASATAVAASVADNPGVELDWPEFGASAVGAVGFPGVLASTDPDSPHPIASITKIITSLVVLEEKPLSDGEPGPTITMTSADVALYGSFIARNGEVRPVWAGLALSQRQVMEIVLIASANNYAQTLATWAFGSEAAFVDAANTWLDNNGLSGTSISDSTGMNPANVSTTTDLIALGKLAMADPTVSAIVAMPSAAIPHLGTIENTNELVGVGGVTGIKTGTLPEAGSCLLFASTIHAGGRDVTIVGVVLGGPDHSTLNAAIRSLIASAAPGFRELPLASAGEAFYTYETGWGQRARAVAARDVSTLVWAGTPIAVSPNAREVRDGKPGDTVGEVVVRVGDTRVAVPLVLDAEVSDPGPWWRLTHPFG